ncbi:hypothetical protein Tsubulata_020953 [Turnera subulata]|uniref:protein-serine/threonine phosphatase n=1 Tax=Turnera subulata TaxID=218843 RepID=A0A9Q0F2A5_9ROSI|nr:hypothetical protein Tsubulata_020953 [Turnera subulata]
MNQLTVIKTVNARRRRLKVRRLKYTCQTRTHVTIAGGVDGEKKISVVERETVITGDVKCIRDTTPEEKKSDRGAAAEISLSFSSSTTSSQQAAVADHPASANDSGLPGPTEGDEIRGDQVLEGYTCISYGSVSVIGKRKEMEDAVRVESAFMGGSQKKYDFFGVYDGHGGARVAEACRDRLHRVVEEEMRKEEKGVMEWERVMEEGFKRMDEEVVKDKMMGSTAVVAVVGEEELVVANCGDSRAVLCRGGVAVPLSVDHKEGLSYGHVTQEDDQIVDITFSSKPDRPEELERVEAAGGRVINWNGHRVLGVLATSRSIGDQFLKPFVISKPDVIVNKRTQEDEFLILASDGLWDVITNEVACQVVRRCLGGRMRRKSQDIVSESSRAAEAAAVLAELAMARGSRDNISVIVIELGRRRSSPLPNLCP